MPFLILHSFWLGAYVHVQWWIALWQLPFSPFRGISVSSGATDPKLYWPVTILTESMFWSNIIYSPCQLGFW